MNVITLGKPGRKGSKKVTVNDDGTLKLGSMKTAKPVAVVFASMTKGEARKLRKGLRAAGRSDLSGVRRAA